MKGLSNQKLLVEVFRISYWRESLHQRRIKTLPCRHAGASIFEKLVFQLCTFQLVINLFYLVSTSNSHNYRIHANNTSVCKRCARQEVSDRDYRLIYAKSYTHNGFFKGPFEEILLAKWLIWICQVHSDCSTFGLRTLDCCPTPDTRPPEGH